MEQVFQISLGDLDTHFADRRSERQDEEPDHLVFSLCVLDPRSGAYLQDHLRNAIPASDDPVLPPGLSGIRPSRMVPLSSLTVLSEEKERIMI